MLLLPPDLLAGVIAHCRAAHPAEACGILAGPAGQDPDGDLRVTRRIEVPNVSGDPGEAFTLDADAQLAAYREMDERGEDPVVLYHSHPRGTAEPSARDIAAAQGGRFLWLIVTAANIRVWRISGGQPSEVELRVVDDDPARPLAH